MPLDLTATLRELISIASVNPMGSTRQGPEYLETRLTDYLQTVFDELKLPWERQTVHPGRDNIVARLEGRPDRVLLWEAHQDTVPVEGMTVPPFTPEVRQGRIYGRGACDIKGGMAAMLHALGRLVELRSQKLPTLVMACCVNEEFGFSGARALPELWSAPNTSLFPRKPDLAIVAEPTQLDVVVAHKGVVRWHCRTRGRAVHTSQPDLGENAIYKMAHVIQAVEHYQQEVIPTLAPHPLCGRPTVCVSTISGGIGVNTVPDFCTIEIERRLVPGENPQQVYQDFVDYLSKHAATSGIEHDPPYQAGRGLASTDNGELADHLVQVAREIEPTCEKIGVQYGTDAAAFGAAGVPSVVFGPGSIAQAHTADEWIEIDQLERASEIYYRLARSL